MHLTPEYILENIFLTQEVLDRRRLSKQRVNAARPKSKLTPKCPLLLHVICVCALFLHIHVMCIYKALGSKSSMRKIGDHIMLLSVNAINIV